jgi:lysylphosphatidylglycerol synthetase-like protein (DUF2156 family)
VANRLLAQRITHWSLGGVPFAVAAHPSPVPTQFYKSMLVNKLGNSFHFAYNSRGLFKFKNKFSPTWQPLYLCAAPKFPWRGLLDLAIKMRYIKLIAYSTLASLPGVSNPGFVD